MTAVLLLEALIPGMIKGLVVVPEETLQRLLFCRSNNNNKVNSLVLLLPLLLLLLLQVLLVASFAAVSVLHIAQCIIIICF